MDGDITNITLIVQIVGIVVGVFFLISWGILIYWVWLDISRRTTSLPVKVLSLLLVVVFYYFGLVPYLFIRPVRTYDEELLETVEARQLFSSGVLECPVCGETVRHDFLYCPACRKRLRRLCVSCEGLVDLHWENCAYCGEVVRDVSVTEALSKKSSATAKKSVVKKRTSSKRKK